MRTSFIMCVNMCGMCSMPKRHIYALIDECDVFMMQEKR